MLGRPPALRRGAGLRSDLPSPCTLGAPYRGTATMRFLMTLLTALLLSSSADARPNVIVFLIDDQADTGSMAYMPKALSLLADHGVTFTNSFVNYPICAPSRSSFLTG
jgi:hypothetical protein